MTDAPIPFTFPSGPSAWKTDPFDALVPRTPGFVSDFVSSLRGNEVPVAFSIWCAVLALSSSLKRETWLDWHPTPLYPNFYILIIAPAGAAKKGVAIDQMSFVLQSMQEYIQNYNVRVMKDMKIFEDKITGEGLAKYLKLYLGKNTGIPLLGPDGQAILHDGVPVVYKKTAELTLVAEELGTMLSRAQYNQDLVTTLTALYNTKDMGGELTVKRGKVRMPNLFTNFIGGTTPDAFRESIPKSAVNEGFLSRMIICYQKECVQCYSVPQALGIRREELASRLAWLAENNSGAWTLSPEAFAHYDKWYKGIRYAFNTAQFHASAQSRFGIHMLKLAVMLMAQRYVSHLKKVSRVVDLEAVKDAIGLLEATARTAPELIEEVESSPMARAEAKLLSYLRKRPEGVTRLRLMQNRHLTAWETTQLITDMHNGGKILVLRNGELAGHPLHDGKEKYRAIDALEEENEDEGSVVREGTEPGEGDGGLPIAPLDPRRRTTARPVAKARGANRPSRSAGAAPARRGRVRKGKKGATPVARSPGDVDTRAS
jgi:hypothetical protein